MIRADREIKQLGSKAKTYAISHNWLRPVFKVINHTRCKLWDVAHGVDTCGEIALTSLDFSSDNKIPGLEYQSHHPKILRDSLANLPIDYKRYTFIDFGCGKGRVLLVACEFGFGRIVGVEFATPLAQIAKRNAQVYRSKRPKSAAIDIVQVDAVDYELPQDPEVLYFYSPFPPEVMEKVFQNIETSLRNYPRDLLVLFSGVVGKRDRAFGSRMQYERLRRDRYVDLYRRVWH